MVNQFFKPWCDNNARSEGRSTQYSRCKTSSCSLLYRCCKPKLCICICKFDQRSQKHPFTCKCWYKVCLAFIAPLFVSTGLSTRFLLSWITGLTFYVKTSCSLLPLCSVKNKKRITRCRPSFTHSRYKAEKQFWKTLWNSGMFYWRTSFVILSKIKDESLMQK